MHQASPRLDIIFCLGVLDSQREYLSNGPCDSAVLLAQNQSATAALKRALDKMPAEADNETKVKP